MAGRRGRAAQRRMKPLFSPLAPVKEPVRDSSLTAKRVSANALAAGGE